jgi:hypothetical protein
MWNGIISISILEHWVENDSIPKRKELAPLVPIRLFHCPPILFIYLFKLHLA